MITGVKNDPRLWYSLWIIGKLVGNVNQLLNKNPPVLLRQQVFHDEGVGHLLRPNVSCVKLKGDSFLLGRLHLTFYFHPRLGIALIPILLLAWLRVLRLCHYS